MAFKKKRGGGGQNSYRDLGFVSQMQQMDFGGDLNYPSLRSHGAEGSKHGQGVRFCRGTAALLGMMGSGRGMDGFMGK